MGFLSDVAIGAAVIALPQGRLPLLGLTLCIQTVKTISRRKRQLRQDEHEGGAPEEAGGAPEPVTLAFQHVQCTLAPKKKEAKAGKDERVLLNDVSGVAKPGRLLALMGPSGSGKTTLLNALAGQVPRSKRMTLRGAVFVNDTPAAAAVVSTGYVAQHDNFYSHSTVQETLEMTAALRLPRGTAPEARAAAVDDALRRLDLRGVADTIVGGRKARGVSGGERKRLAIACELLSRPSLLFLDEPTTGLDAFQALKVVEALQELAAAGHTIIASIHQPRSRIFDLFDDLLLLSMGTPVFCGAAADALPHFEALGHACPPHHNPAEFLADLISYDNASDESTAASRDRLDRLAASAPGIDEGASAAADKVEAAAAAAPPQPQRRRPPPLPLQLRMLFKRSWKQVTRDRAALRLRVATNIQSAVVFGGIWWRLRRLQASVLSRIGLLQVVAVYLSQTALFKTLNLFPPEKSLVGEERAKGAYGALPYFLSKILAELPIAAAYPLVFSAVVYPMTNLQPSARKFAMFAGSNVLETLSSTALGMAVGAAAPSTDSALVLGPAIMLVFVVFGGLYTNQSDVPRWLRWVPHTSAIKAGYDALCKNEFKGLELEGEGPGSFRTGEEVLERQGFSGTAAGSIAQQGRILMFYWWLTLCILRADKPRFQPMLPPLA